MHTGENARRSATCAQHDTMILLVLLLLLLLLRVPARWWIVLVGTGIL